jgi:hypothetical protein
MTYHDARLVKRYMFDLNAVVEDLKTVADLSESDEELARAWVINHLSEIHYIDITPIGTMPWDLQRQLHDKIETRSGRFTQALTSTLWHNLRKMSLHVCNCSFFDITFNHDILLVAVYD